LSALKPTKSLIYGTSGGAIAAACYLSGVDPDKGLEVMKEMSEKSRGKRWYGVGSINDVVRSGIEEEMRSSFGGNESKLLSTMNKRLRVCVSRIHPLPPTLMVVSSFKSVEDVVDCILTSSHLPFFMSSSFTTTFRGLVFYLKHTSTINYESKYINYE